MGMVRNRLTAPGVTITEMTNGYRLETIEVQADQRFPQSPPDRSYHGAIDLRRYLSGHSKTIRRTERDSYRQRLYDAEKKAGLRDLSRDFEDLLSCAKFVGQIIRHRWWQTRYDVRCVLLTPGYGAKSAAASGSGFSCGRVRLPKNGRNDKTILHELIHLTVPKPHAGHGRLYAARYVEIIGAYFGADAGYRLRSPCSLQGV